MNHNSKYKNVIFDLGGVLVNWSPKQIIADIFRDKEYMSFELWKELFASDLFQGIDRGTLTLSDLYNEMPEKYDKKQFKFFFDNLHEHLFILKSGLKIFDHIKSLGYKTYVLSNFGKEMFEKVEPSFDFLKSFDGAIMSYKVKAIKPESEIYKILLNTYSLNPLECIFIDDLQANIDGAKAMGIDGIVCKDHEYVWQELERLNVIPIRCENEKTDSIVF